MTAAVITMVAKLVEVKKGDHRIAFLLGLQAAEKGEPMIAPHVWPKLKQGWFDLGYLSLDDQEQGHELLEAHEDYFKKNRAVSFRSSGVLKTVERFGMNK